MSDPAHETVAEWLGARQPRELMVATIFAALAHPIILDCRARQKTGEAMDIPAELRKLIESSVNWADSINAYCKEHPVK